MTTGVAVNSGGTGLAVDASSGTVLSWDAVASGVVAGATPLVVYSGSAASSISGLLSWHDGGVKPSTGYGVTLGSLPNGVAGAPAMTFNSSGANGQQLPTGARAIPRLMGPLSGLGGVGATLAPSYGPLAPLIDTSVQATVAGLAMGSGVGRTVHLTWSRPNRLAVPFSGYSSGALALLSIGGAALLTLTNGGGADTLALNGTALATTLTTRHTHSVTLRWTAGGTIDAWVDDAAAGTGLANPIASAATGLSVGLGSAGVYFHELAVYDHALSSGDMATLLTGATSVSKRWPRGARTGQNVLAIGQSNAGFFVLDAEAQWQESVRYHLGSLAVNLLTGSNRLPAAPNNAGTTPGGTPLYATGAGTFLADPGTGAAPSTWPLGGNGTQVDTVLGALPTADLADVRAVWWYYSENDSQRAYSEKAIYEAVVVAYLAHVRSQTGRTAATMPLLEVSALPYAGANAPAAPSNVTGIAAIREAVADLVASGTSGTVVVLPNTAAGWGRGAAADGTGGDLAHLDSADNLRHAQLAGPIVAAALATAGAADGTTLPANLAALGGPRIAAALRESSTSILVTVAHDAGTDLAFPGGASQGWGWVLYDGWASVTSPGTRRAVSAAVRVDATHLRLTVATMTAAASGCRLYYGDGNAKIGRGSAVTDNYSTCARPAGADIGSDLGASWAPDMPLAVTPYGIALT